jgi:uncharacterized protein (TIGR02996 family)
MNEETFLAALLDNPTDELTWQALADWLDDGGQPDRAELLRLSRRLRATPPRERGDLPNRVTGLLDAGVRPVVLELVNSIGMRFVFIPPGRFLMGSPASEIGRLGQERRHEVELTRPFWLGVFPVTQAQWTAVMGHNPSFFRAGQTEGVSDTRDYPVEQVSWEDSREFLDRLSALPAERERGHLYRLPTEAEWEHACRGFGAYSAYHFGDRISHRNANFIGSGLGRTCKVGSYKPNAFGLFDMHGNVWEWCADAFGADYYRGCPREDPCNEGYQDTDDRAIRGGAYFFQCQASSHVPVVECDSVESAGAYYGQCRSAAREGWPNNFAFRDLGLRAALVISTETKGARRAERATRGYQSTTEPSSSS